MIPLAVIPLVFSSLERFSVLIFFFYRCVTSSKIFAKFCLKQISWLVCVHFGIRPKSVFIQFESLSFVKLFFGKGCRLSFRFVSMSFFRQQFSSNVIGKFHCLHRYYTAIWKFIRVHVQPITTHQTEATWLKKTECPMNLTSMEGTGWPPKTIHIFNVHKHFKSRWNCLNQGNVFRISLNVTDTLAPFYLCSFPSIFLNIFNES